mgnify:CR=1 FL=1
MTTDPRDQGDPGIKEWEEFRASYASAFLLTWLSEEAGDLLREYAQDLENRFMSGWDIQDTFDQDPGEPEELRGFPLPGVGGVEREDYVDHLTWMDEWQARLLYSQLFPHRDSVRDFPQTVAGMAVVALHAAIETYSRSRGISAHGPLPRALADLLKQRGRSSLLDAETMRWLADCDATRHLIVHNRGVVDERYIRSVQYTTMEAGEFRRVSAEDLHHFAEAVYRVATILRELPEGNPEQ